MQAVLAKLAPSLLPFMPHLAIKGEAARIVQEAPAPLQALERLERADLLVEACRVLAHALPAREAIWWACMCARHTSAPGLGDSEADQAALQAAAAWVRRPADDVRRAGFGHAERAEFSSPEAWAAVAAFWSGDSMSPLGQPKVPPAPHLAGTAVAGAISLAAVRGAPERRDQRLRRFMASGREIAAGGAGRLASEDKEF